MLRTSLKPGDSVSGTRIFRVHHYQHRLSHLVKVTLETLPECQYCGDRVRYESVDITADDQIELLRLDRDFQHVDRKLRSG